MGLDMYLSVKKSGYVKGKAKTINLDKLENNIDFYESDEFGCSNRVTIEKNVAYWRKANAIHKWFVDNVQEGEDDCKEYYVSIEQLKELRDICKDILKMVDKKKFYIPKENLEKYKDNYKDVPTEFAFDASNLEKMWNDSRMWNYEIELTKKVSDFITDNLAPEDGFFFGSTKIDGGYFYDLVKTVLMIDRVIANADKYDDFYYCASWQDLK